VVTLAILALTVNLIITYALARRALKPLLERLMKRMGYSLPNMEEGDLTDLTIVLRVTPGTPFFIQNYLLGLAGVPFGKYLLVSCIVTWIYTGAFVMFGDAILRGKGKMAIFAGSLLIAAVVITQWARKKYGKKKVAKS
ncbi:MAG: VTT domain-containing protein, partial [Opitutus sp.]